MFALRSIVVLMLVSLATGLRQVDSVSQLSPEEVEEKAVEVLESLTPKNGDQHMIPLEASFQVAPTMGDMPVKTKMTLLLARAPPKNEPLSLSCQLTAKHEVGATNFAKSLNDYIDAKMAFLNTSLPVKLEITAPGRQVLIKVVPDAHSAHAVVLVQLLVQLLAKNVGHLNASVDLDVDMQEIMAHLSNDTVLYDELYKGFKYSVDLTLTKSLEELLAKKLPPTAPDAPFSPQAIVSKLFHVFTGASADMKVAFDESTRSELIRSIPFVNMTYGQLVSLYRPLVSMYPAMLRGSDLALKTVDILLGLEAMETLDTVELHGVPGVQLMMVGNTTSGAFDFMSKFVKDIGLVEVLRNTSTEFSTFPQYVPPPELNLNGSVAE